MAKSFQVTFENSFVRFHTPPPLPQKMTPFGVFSGNLRAYGLKDTLIFAGF